ncbi:hypothetical protein MKQ70_16120 [Chitinophaga sedimenti]|uniref:hypothetical protein n=1 Tax=Chitinophaga sedimenti TaxID=2033606 RepID=UPI002002A07C|nr:hypothetical protein [Chitinophaga sedimenti]MCK7556458.1 hypothetical protein [Chitinophaga sedimenti]
MNLQQLSLQEMKEINGGLLGLFGGNDSSNMLKGMLEGYVSITTTDEDGDTNSTKLNFGLGSIFDSISRED